MYGRIPADTGQEGQVKATDRQFTAVAVSAPAPEFASGVPVDGEGSWHLWDNRPASTVLVITSIKGIDSTFTFGPEDSEVALVPSGPVR